MIDRAPPGSARSMPTCDSRPAFIPSVVPAAKGSRLMALWGRATVGYCE